MKNRINSPFFFLVITFLSLIIFSGCTSTGMTNNSTQSLYHRLGGYDAVAAVVDDFMKRMGNDPTLKRFFKGMEPESGKRTRQLIVDFVCAATGGPCFYTGRDMKTTHTGMGITEADWDIAAGHLTATLDTFKVPAREKNELLSLVSSLKIDMVEK